MEEQIQKSVEEWLEMVFIDHNAETLARIDLEREVPDLVSSIMAALTPPETRGSVTNDYIVSALRWAYYCQQCGKEWLGWQLAEECFQSHQEKSE